MAHRISGIIGRSDTLDKLRYTFHEERPASLAQGFSFLPLDSKNLASIVGNDKSAAIIDFEYLDCALQQLLVEASKVGALAYVETEYFGGEGTQSAAVFKNGAIVLDPTIGEGGAINQALEILGVTVSMGEHDAFDALGLGHRRWNDDYR